MHKYSDIAMVCRFEYLGRNVEKANQGCKSRVNGQPAQNMYLSGHDPLATTTIMTLVNSNVEIEVEQASASPKTLEL